MLVVLYKGQVKAFYPNRPIPETQTFKMGGVNQRDVDRSQSTHLCLDQVAIVLWLRMRQSVETHIWCSIGGQN